MAEDWTAAGAAAGPTGHMLCDHGAALQAVPAQFADVHGHHRPPGAAVASQQPSWQQYSSVFTASKAGMQNVDKEKVKRVVYEMSKDSAHFKNEQRKQEQVDARIAQLKAKAAGISQAELAAHQKAADAKLAQLEAGRDLSRTWLHADMDAFYASVEELDRPDLKDKPMAVGGMGMITTANYEARKFGVRSAMPGFIARKLCPQLVFVKPDFRKYEAASVATREVFKVYDPHFEAGSLDEAYLDVTDYCAQHGVTGEQVAAQLRAGVEAATQLTCSVGIAPNATLAKVASDLNKPNGQALVVSSREAVMAFVHDLPIRKVPGIGKVSEQTLNALGITTCGHLLQQRGQIAALFSSISARFFLGAGLGLGHTQHGSDRGDEGGAGGGAGVARKGISCERTFANMSSAADMEKMAEHLVQHLASDMESEGIEAKTLTLKLKTTDFAVRTRAVTLPGHVHTAQQMLPPILKLLRAELPCEIRLMGVRGSALRRVTRTGEVLNAAVAAGRLNALQRMILQGRRQQQQQQGEAADQQQGQQDGGQQSVPEEAAGVEAGQYAPHQAEHQGASAAVSYDVLDDDSEHGDDSCSLDELGTDYESTFAAWDAAASAAAPAGQAVGGDSGVSAGGALDAAASFAAGSAALSSCMAGAAVAAQELDRQQRDLLQQQRQWQQECGHTEQLVAQLNVLHKQQQDMQGSPSAKRSRLDWCEAGSVEKRWQQRSALDMPLPPDHQQQQRHLGVACAAAGDPQACEATAVQEHDQPRLQPLLSGQRYRASQLPADWQQQQQQQQHQQHQQQHQQEDEAAAVEQLQGLPSQLQHCQVAEWQRSQHHNQHFLPVPQPLQQQQQPQQQQLDSSHMGEPSLQAGTYAGSAAATSSRQQSSTAGGRSSSSRGGSSSSTWACMACTFSGNKQVMLRCEMCGTPKGSSTPPAPGWLSGGAVGTPAAGQTHSKAGAGQQVGKRGRGHSSSRDGGSRGTSRANGKQLTLDQVVQPPA